MSRCFPDATPMNGLSSDVSSEDELLGERPPWVLGACILGAGTVCGLAFAAVLLLSTGEETLAFPATVERISPIAVRAPASGQIDAIYARDRDAVIVGRPLARLRIVGADNQTVFPEVLSPGTGTLSFLRTLSRGSYVAVNEEVMAIQGPRQAPTLVVFASSDEVQQLRGDCRVHIYGGRKRTAPLQGTVSSIAPLPSHGKYRVVISLGPEPARDLLQENDGQATAIIVIRERNFLERSLEVLRRFLTVLHYSAGDREARHVQFSVA